MNEDKFPFENEEFAPDTPLEGSPSPEDGNPPHLKQHNAVVPGSGTLSAPALIERDRALQEVQAMVVMAQRFPRNPVTAEAEIMAACEYYEFASKSLFQYKRGGQKIEGGTIRFAELIASAWGHMNYGFRVLECYQRHCVVESFCWDMQRGTLARRTTHVKFELKLKDGRTKYLTDPRDQYEMTANYANRRVRACIEQMIPLHLRMKALARVKLTIAEGPKNKPWDQRVADLVKGFKDEGVTVALLEKYLDHPIATLSKDEFVDLMGVFNSIKTKECSREEFFDLGGGKSEGGPAEELDGLLKGKPIKEEKAT